MSPRVRPYGDRALLVELGSTEEVVVVADRARSVLADRVADVVPGARTVLLVARPGTSIEQLKGDVPTIWHAEGGAGGAERWVPRGPEVEVPVSYDGPDLAYVARLTGLAEDEVVAAHTGTPWQVAFGGFAPGFAYLVGGDPRLRVPRRASPRTKVPAGAVGLAGEFSGVYPRESPGGWQLLGRTDAVTWDVDRDPPALLSPGATVRFVAR